MKKLNKKNIAVLVMLISLLILIITSSCNTQKRITLTDQKITYKVDANIIVPPEHKPKIKKIALTKIVYDYDTITIETIRTKVKTYYDTVYKKIVTKVKSKPFKMPVKINKTIETKSKEKIKETDKSTLRNSIILFCVCALILFYVFKLVKKNLL